MSDGNPQPTQPVQPPPGQPQPGQPQAQPQPQGQPPAGAPHPGYAGPPPGYVAPPPGYAGPPPGFGAPPAAAGPSGSGTTLGGTALLSLLSAVGVAVATFVEEDHLKGWDTYGVWGIFAIVAAVVTMAPAVRGQFNLSETRAWQIAAGGAAGLAVYWVLLILPSIERNLSFVATAAVALGILAAWLAPGRPDSSGTGSAGETW